PRAADPRHPRLLAARRRRRAHHRRDRARPRARGAPETPAHRGEGRRIMTTMTGTTQATRVIPGHAKPLRRRMLLTRESAIIGLLVLVVAVASVTVRGFGQPITLNYLLLDIAPILLIALPMTLIMVTGEIDLSVGSMVGLSSVVTGVAVQAGIPFEAAAVIALLVGVVGGAFNGFLVTVVGLPSLAVTIGTLALFRGLAVGLLGTTAVTDFPETWTALAKARIAGTTIPYIMVPFLILLVVFV